MVRKSISTETSRRSFCGRLRSIAIAAALAALPGCVERTVSINTEPQGATVILNDQEVGKSPVKVPFTWYGDYDIILRKEGYETVKTNKRLRAPWYQTPGIDIISEALVPFTIHDDRELDVFVMNPRQPVDKGALLQSAAELRQRATGSSAE